MTAKLKQRQAGFRASGALILDPQRRDRFASGPSLRAAYLPKPTDRGCVADLPQRAFLQSISRVSGSLALVKLGQAQSNHLSKPAKMRVKPSSPANSAREFLTPHFLHKNQ